MMTTRIKVGLTAGTCLIFSQSLMAEVSVFNPALLEIDHQSGVDIRQFNRANLMPPCLQSHFYRVTDCAVIINKSPGHLASRRISR